MHSHSLKTSVNYLGLEEIKNLSLEIENLSANDDGLAKIKMHFENISELWEKVKPEIERFLKNKKGL